MTGSASVAVRRAVIDGLAEHFETLPEFNGHEDAERNVLVRYAYSDSGHAEQVCTGLARAETDPSAIRTGRNHRDEQGNFDLLVRAVIVGASPDEPWAADERAFAIGREVEDWIGARKSGGGIPGCSELTVRSWDSKSGATDSGYGCLIVYKVHWRARLT